MPAVGMFTVSGLQPASAIDKPTETPDAERKTASKPERGAPARAVFDSQICMELEPFPCCWR
jgi:hypothetical protein